MYAFKAKTFPLPPQPLKCTVLAPSGEPFKLAHKHSDSWHKMPQFFSSGFVNLLESEESPTLCHPQFTQASLDFEFLPSISSLNFT
jgi:hypothetical protein